jgi:hypothetical protein
MADMDVLIGYLVTTPDMIRGIVVPELTQKIVPLTGSYEWLSPIFEQGRRIIVRSVDDNEAQLVAESVLIDKKFWESNLMYLTAVVFRYLENHNFMENVYLFYRIVTENYSFKLSCAAYEIPEFSKELFT